MAPARRECRCYLPALFEAVPVAAQMRTAPKREYLNRDKRVRELVHHGSKKSAESARKTSRISRFPCQIIEPRRQRFRKPCDRRAGRGLAQLFAPDGVREMRVVTEARYDMPVQMGGHVAQAGEVDLVRSHQLAQCRLDRQYDAQEVRALARRQIGHFLDVGIPDDPAEPGIAGLRDQHDATARIAPQDLATGALTQFACHEMTIRILRAASGCRAGRRGGARPWQPGTSPPAKPVSPDARWPPVRNDASDSLHAARAVP